MLVYATLLFFIIYLSCYARVVKKPTLVYQENSYIGNIVNTVSAFHKHFFPFIIYSKRFIESKVYQFRPTNEREYERITLLSEENDELFMDVYEIKNQTEFVKKTEFYFFDKILMKIYKIIPNFYVKTKKEEQINFDDIKSDKTVKKSKNVVLKRKPFGNKDNVLLIHGFNGSSSVSYIKNLAFVLKNYRVFALNARGSSSNLKTEKFFHIGFTDDLDLVVKYILKNYDGKLTLIGFSMGSSWVTNYLANVNNSRILCGIGVCVPFDFNDLNRHHNSSCVSLLMAIEFKKFLNKHKVFDKYKYENLTTVEQIDSLITTKVFNFESNDEYYVTQSCKGKLSKIQTPMLFINTKDDPLIPSCTLPFEEIKSNPYLLLCLLETGGHLGMMDLFFKKSFLEIIIEEFLENVKKIK